MSMHPIIMSELADQHRQDMLTKAAARRRVRDALGERPLAASTGQVLARRAARLVQAMVSRSAGAHRPLPDEG